MVDWSRIEHRVPEWVSNPSNSASGNFAVHVFGPYRAQYQGILEEIVEFLRAEKYTQASTCAQLPNHSTSGMSRPVQNWWESVYCMETADAAIFLILQPDDSRLEGKPREGLNASVIAELTFWTHFFATDTPSLALIEGEMTEVGSLISGIVDIYSLEKAHVNFDDIDRMKNITLMRCNSWVR